MSGLSKKSAVFKHFKKSEEEGKLMCQIKDGEKVCNEKVSAKTSNMKRHVDRKHPDIGKEISAEDAAAKHTGVTQVAASAKEPQQAPISSFFSSEKVTIFMTKEKLEQCIIKMVVENGIPLSFFSSKGFLELNGELASKLGVSLERHDVRKLVIAKAEQQKEALKKELKDKFLFLKLDACTRHRVNYLGINVQFVNSENKLDIQTLAVRDTEAQHNSDFIRDTTEAVLKDYDIKKQQVLAIVTDNASNMTSFVEKFNQSNSEDEESDFDSSVELDEEEVSYSVMELGVASHMRCAVHTLQLAIRDGLKKNQVKQLVTKLRQIAAIARTLKIDAILKRKTSKGAIIDQATRWGSTYLMIQRLIELRDAIQDLAHPELTLTDSKWDEVKELFEMLKYPFLATKRMQAANLTPGSFLKEWKTLIFTFDRIGGKVANAIKNSMHRREKTLMNNDVLLSAIYVDPKYRLTLSEDQFQRGKQALSGIAMRMYQFNRQQNDASQENAHVENAKALSSTSDPYALSSSDDELDYERHLDLQAKRQRVDQGVSSGAGTNPTVIFRTNFEKALTEIEKIDRSSKLDVMQAINKYPDIVKKVAYTVTALPPTQVSVERLFSALRIIRSDLRASMKEDLVEAILFLRTNYL